VLQRELTSRKQEMVIVLVMELVSCSRHTRVTMRHHDTDMIDWRRETYSGGGYQILSCLGRCGWFRRAGWGSRAGCTDDSAAPF
jgi:hypothetical protein